jgi:hypothetical protein
MYPMMNSESPWTLKTTNKNSLAIVNNLKQSKKSSSLFDIDNVQATFVGSDQLSPFDFDSFAVCLLNQIEADSIKIGICIRYYFLRTIFENIFLIYIYKNQNRRRVARRVCVLELPNATAAVVYEIFYLCEE